MPLLVDGHVAHGDVHEALLVAGHLRALVSIDVSAIRLKELNGILIELERLCVVQPVLEHISVRVFVAVPK